ncbi:endonuclease domain of the non-LTR retrotransposon LINE-1 [Elysia marginata]|uniref:Endonuclease domain of the non-LTR retrotransposon LINE-1 n=1 Tax=Elysia marginata TaxID=1093978 RepID=A0AAV4JCH2_9GAST|nr:endonuclease domain of the non-LTR retrotransposon LINE-1 [Elysia marginata]
MKFQCFAWTILFVILFLCGPTFQTFQQNQHAVSTPPFKYTPAILRSLNRPSVNVNKNNLDPYTPPGPKPRKRGRKGGVRERLKRRRSRPFFPELIIGNARSRNNKVDELRACTNYLNECRCASLLCFSETWFQESASDSSFDIDNFCLKRSDRTKASNKSRGGGTFLYINEKWCHPNNVHVKQQLCTPDLEMLTVVLRPFYLPREFTKATVN